MGQVVEHRISVAAALAPKVKEPGTNTAMEGWPRSHLRLHWKLPASIIRDSMARRTHIAPPGRLARVAARSAEIAARELLGSAGSLKRLLQKGDQRGPKIGFQAFATHLALFFEPLIGELRREGAAQLVFVLLDHPHFPRDEVRRLRAMATERFGLSPEHVRSSRACRWERFDLMLYADLYARFPRLSARNGLLLHGTPNPDRCFTRGLFRKTVYDFDFALVFGQHDRELFRRREPPSSAGLRVHAVGCPLLDRVLTPPQSREAYLEGLGLDPSLRTVLYGPHWSLLDGTGPRFRGQLVDTVRAMAHPRRNLILKPHRMMQVYASCPPARWGEVLREAGGANLAVDMDEGDLLALLHSDVLVSDISTRLFNYMLLDKPAIVFAPGFVPVGELEIDRQRMLDEVCARADDLGELARCIDEALEQPRRTSAPRTRIASRCFSNFGCSTGAAVRALKQEMGEKAR